MDALSPCGNCRSARDAGNAYCASTSRSGGCVEYPTGDTVAWAARLITNENITAPENGMPVGTRRVRTLEGFLSRSDYLDGLLRLVLRVEFDAIAKKTTYLRRQYNSNGQVTFQSYPSSTSAATDGIQTIYDAIGRLLERKTNSGVITQSVRYYGLNSLEVTDASGNKTIYTYQASGTPDTSRPVLIEMKAEDQQTVIKRDVFGHVTEAWQDAIGIGERVTRTYLYDDHMRLCKVIEPESGQTVTAYDAASQIAWTASGQNGDSESCDYASVPANQKTTYTYSDVGRRTGITYGDATGNVTIGYDNDGNMTSMSNPGAAWTWTYNRRGLLEGERAVIDSQTFTLGREYDIQGSLKTLTYPDSTSIALAPDSWGRPTKLGNLASNITYFPNNVPAAYTLGNGATYGAELNGRQWLKSSTLTKGQVLQKFTYGYNDDGDLTSIADGVTSADSATLAYDGLHRLSGAVGCWGTYGYDYDANNNITERFGTRAFSYKYQNNRLVRIEGGDDIFADGFDGGSVGCPATYTGGPATFEYNSRGQRTKGGRLGSALLTWNLGNQLVSIQGQATYGYDGRGLRTKTVASGQTEYAIYDLSGALVYTQKGTTKTSYVSLSGRPFASVSGATTTYLHPDLLGSPRAATNASGQVTWRANYDPFGVRVGGGTEKVGYTGHALDATGLTYMQARYYDAAVGRLLSTDPKQFDPNSTASFNRYSYAANNPYRYVDPDGKQARDLSYIWQVSGATSPPKSPDDWLGPAIGGALTVAFVPAAGYGALELGWAALANPVATATIVNTVADVGAGEALGGASLAVATSRVARLADEALVVRGGSASGANSMAGLLKGTGTHPSGVTGFSAESANGFSFCQLCANIRHNQVGSTTVGEIRAAGGDVISTGGVSPTHATVTGLDPAAANKLFTPTVENPIPLDERLTR